MSYEVFAGMKPLTDDERIPEEPDEDPVEPVFDDPDDQYPEDDPEDVMETEP